MARLTRCLQLRRETLELFSHFVQAASYLSGPSALATARLACCLHSLLIPCKLRHLLPVPQPWPRPDLLAVYSSGMRPWSVSFTSCKLRHLWPVPRLWQWLLTENPDSRLRPVVLVKALVSSGEPSQTSLSYFLQWFEAALERWLRTFCLLQLLAFLRLAFAAFELRPQHPRRNCSLRRGRCLLRGAPLCLLLALGQLPSVHGVRSHPYSCASVARDASAGAVGECLCSCPGDTPRGFFQQFRWCHCFCATFFISLSCILSVSPPWRD